MSAQELFIEYRGEFENLFLDVEDEISALMDQFEDPGMVVATPGPDVIRILRVAFNAADYGRGPVQPVALIKALCRDETVGALLKACEVPAEALLATLDELSEDTSDAFRGWLPRLLRRHWYRNQWTRELARLLAHASLEGGLRHRSHFTCADVLLASWSLEHPVCANLGLPMLTRARLRSVLAHGTVDLSPLSGLNGAASAWVNLRLYYDVYSSNALVAHVVGTLLGVTEPQACLEAVYHLGSQAVGPYDLHDALERAHQAQALALSEDAPLRLSVEPLSPSEYPRPRLDG